MTSRKRGEEALRHFRAAMDISPDMIFLIDRASMQIVDVNDRTCQVLGYRREELLAMGPQDVAPLPREELSRLFDQVIAGGASFSAVEMNHRRRDGTLVPVELYRRAVPSRDGYTIVIIARDITERHHAEEMLRKSEGRFRLFVEQSPDAMVIHQASRIIFANEAMLRLLRAGPGDSVLDKPGLSLVHADYHEIAEARRVRLYAGLTVPLVEQVYVRLDGTTVEVEVASSPIVLDGQPTAVVTVREVTARKEQERKIARMIRIRAVLSGVNSAIVRIRDQQALFAEACRIIVEQGRFSMVWIGLVEHETAAIKPVAWAGAEHGLLAVLEPRLVLDPSEPRHGLAATAVTDRRPVVVNDVNTDVRVASLKDELRVRAIASLAILPLLVSGEAVGVLALHADAPGFFDEQELRLLVELAADIAFAIELIEKEKKLNYLAYYDVLTGLANRSLFFERVGQYIRSAVAGRHRLALFLIDLERFKNINDSLGQAAGDTLLKQVAQWLTVKVGDASVLARVDADHFAAVLPQVRLEGDVARLIESMMAAFLLQPFRLNDAVFRISAKVGVALFPDDGIDADSLFKNAEAALKKAKANGERFLFYTQRMTAMVAGKLTLENQLRHALDKGEFVLHYQPKVSLVSGKLNGVEALIRWNDPRTGLISPARFIPVLEETGLINEVGRWSLRKAVEDHLRWREAGLAAVRIAVNVSPLQLRNRGFIGEIRQAIGIDADGAEGLELEITESLIMEDVRNSIGRLQAIRAMGVRIAIDDFGTGFSSLSYLSRLPVDTLKIDRSFVVELTAGPEGLALVSTIIHLAHSLKMNVIAEGVETEEQSRLLRLLDCNEMQGFLFSKAVPSDVLEAKFLALPALEKR
jgi:diguanylate cyclase (GGDEF)-like protein/PAS domain S-box-containing protein